MTKNTILGEYNHTLNKIIDSWNSQYSLYNAYCKTFNKIPIKDNKNAKNTNKCNIDNLDLNNANSLELDNFKSYLQYKAKYTSFSDAQLEFIELVKSQLPISIGDILHVVIKDYNEVTTYIHDSATISENITVTKMTLKVIDIKSNLVTYFNDTHGSLIKENCYHVLKESLINNEGYTTRGFQHRNIKSTKDSKRMSQDDITLIKTLYM